MHKFLKCEICENNSWKQIYKGKIRKGEINTYEDGAIVKECNFCGVQRLSELNCLKDKDYEKKSYRKLVNKSNSMKYYYKLHDQIQIYYLDLLKKYEIRNKNILEIGCGGGSFLDLVSNYAKNVTAIEPNKMYQKNLKKKGYKVYSNLEELDLSNQKFDYIFSFQVIEHVDNPRLFFTNIKNFMNKNTILFITTPNKEDILMKSNLKKLKKFFYRKVHRWYFDKDSLQVCIKKSNLKIKKISFIHKYDFDNFLKWTTGKNNIDNKINKINNFDSQWKTLLEREGVSDLIAAEIII